MPTWETPERRILNALKRIRKDTIDQHTDESLTIEPIQAVKANRHVVVGGVDIPTTGTYQARAGEPAAVVRKGGQPVVALKHNARRAQFPTVEVEVGGQIIEELFLATNIESGVREVYFRNYDHVASLNLKHLTPGINYDTVKWGQNADHFIARRQGGHVWDHFKLSRNPKKPMGAKQTPSVTLVETKNIADGSMAVDTVTLVFSAGAPSPQSVALTNSISITAVTGLDGVTGSVSFATGDDNQGNYVILDNRNHFIVTYLLVIGVRAGATQGFGPFFDVSYNYPYVLDVTGNTVLLNTYQNPLQVDLAIGMTGVSHVVNSDLAGLGFTFDPDGAFRSTLYVPFWKAKMGYVTDGAIDNVVISATYIRYLGTTEGFPEFGIITGGGVALHPSGLFPFPTILEPLTVPAEGLSGQLGLLPTGPTNQHAGPLINRYHVGFIGFGGPTTSAKFASFALNTTAIVDPDRDHFNTFGFIALDPDFLYVIKDEITKSHRYFVNGWNFSTGTVTLSSTAANFPPADSKLKEVGTLFQLPSTITLFTGLIAASFHAINDSSILSPLGRFKRS